ncbi:unnamed protein product [Rotaria sordida]|uniref:Tr-type G domain-containing protein n=1 Tax=Rotaria sordida TaxID=392033 RepID=A0A815W8G8_9BILA|nr:unnamed protein product [Rotaria sordida]CAF1544627.1 unnamed protein product [Rotaria sordida]
MELGKLMIAHGIVNSSVLGTVNSSKSLLIGVCTYGELDNSQRRARLNLFRHLHEIQTGRTPSITYEILGFSDAGETANEICDRSTKIIAFIDLSGHKKYMKIAVFGLAALHPDFATLCVDAPTGIGMFSFLKGLPVFIVINKIDLCSQATIQQTLECLTSLLKRGDGSVQLKPYFIQNEADLTKAADMFVNKNICPILSVSCVTGQNIDLLKRFFNILLPRLSSSKHEILSELPVEYRVRQSLFIHIILFE